MCSLFSLPHHEALLLRCYCKFSWIEVKTIDGKQILNTPLTYCIYTITGFNSYVSIQQTYCGSSLYLHHFEVSSFTDSVHCKQWRNSYLIYSERNSSGDWIRVQVKLVWVYELQQCGAGREMGKNSVGVSCPWLIDDRELMYSVNMCVCVGFWPGRVWICIPVTMLFLGNWKRSKYMTDVATYILAVLANQDWENSQWDRLDSGPRWQCSVKYIMDAFPWSPALGAHSQGATPLMT